MPALLRPTPDGFLRAGEPHLLISGALHYFRVHPAQWRDRLRRLVAMGCITVETSVARNVHQPAPAVVTFEGSADLGRFLDLAAEEGLDAIVRPGPYICGSAPRDPPPTICKSICAPGRDTSRRRRRSCAPRGGGPVRRRVGSGTEPVR